jgi:uncharacterized protein with PQ loop repeat
MISRNLLGKKAGGNMTLIGGLYSTVGLIVMLGYMPQIVRLWRTRSDCTDISVLTWMIWNYTAFISLLYSVFEIGDLKFSLVNAVNFICINIIIFLTLYKRRRFAQGQAESLDAQNPL